MTTAPQNARSAALEALIEAHSIELNLPTVRRRFRALAQEATREQQTPTAYLGAVLEAEMAERAERREKRRLIDAFRRSSAWRTSASPTPPTFRKPRSPPLPRARGSPPTSRGSATAASGKIDQTQQPTPGGATSSHRAGASASHRLHSMRAKITAADGSCLRHVVDPPRERPVIGSGSHHA